MTVEKVDDYLLLYYSMFDGIYVLPIDELVSRYPKRVARSVYNLLMCQISAHGNE